jgi:hypothetical protein
MSPGAGRARKEQGAMKRFGSAGWSGGFRENGVIQPFTYSDSNVFTPKIKPEIDK